MRPALVDTLLAGREWIYEVKWDGYRAEAWKHGDVVRLISHKNENLSGEFPSVVEAVRGIRAHMALLDGKIVAVNANGQPSFQVLQNRLMLGPGWQIVYFAFDLLNRDSRDLTGLPLSERKAQLNEVLGHLGVRFNAEIRGAPAAIVKVSGQAGLESGVAKRRHSLYQSRTRGEGGVHGGCPGDGRFGLNGSRSYSAADRQSADSIALESGHFQEKEETL